MSPVEAWKEKFQLSTSCTLKEALKNQLINEIEYQEWASKYYRLPIMEDAFFTEHPSETNFLDKIKKLNIATSSAIPCFEWNNTLYIACLEPQQINTSQQAVFFITSLKNMESLWQNIQPSEEESHQKKQVTSITPQPPLQNEKTLNTPKNPVLKKMDNDGIEFEYMNPSKSIVLFLSDLIKSFIHFIAPEKKLSSKTKRHLQGKKIGNNKQNIVDIESTGKSVQHSLESDESREEEKKHNEKNEIPTPITLKTEDDKPPLNTPSVSQKTLPETDGIPKPIALTTEDNEKLSKVKEDLNFLGNDESEESKHDKHKKDDMPKPIALETESNNASDNTPPTTQKLSPSSSEEEEPPTPIASKSEGTNPPPKTSSDFSSEKEEAPAPITLNTEDDKINNIPSTTATPSLKEEIVENELKDSTQNTSRSFLILDQKKVTSLDQLNPLRRALEETKHYVNSYILFVFKKDAYIPYKWSSNLQDQKKAQGTIQKPSIFRIVHVSKQAYFGHLAPVLANNSFFNQWGFETLPKHVVLIPFLDTNKQNMLGVYLGISKTRILPIKCLHAIEQIVQSLSSYYEDGSLLKKVS